MTQEEVIRVANEYLSANGRQHGVLVRSIFVGKDDPTYILPRDHDFWLLTYAHATSDEPGGIDPDFFIVEVNCNTGKAESLPGP